MLFFQAMNRESAFNAGTIQPAVCSGAARRDRYDSRTLRMAAYAPAFGGLLLGIVGCSASSQAEYHRIRAIVVAPSSGDGATLTSIDPTRYRGLSGIGSAVALGKVPGTASDQPIIAE